MENKIKFTSDGKKVVVIGNLNSQEKIVQEIFVVDGSEVPSGEHFVVKSLHDSPAVSWKEAELKKLEERYNTERSFWQKKIDGLYKEFGAKSVELREKLNYIGGALKNADEKSFETLVDFITGKIKWIVVDHYSPQLLPIEDFNQMYENRLRLMSLFGKDDGSFTYAVGDYYDYSGGNKKFFPFLEYEDAVKKLEELIIASGVSEYNIKTAKKHGIMLPEDLVSAWKQNRIDEFQKSINSYKETIESYENKINELKA